MSWIVKASTGGEHQLPQAESQKAIIIDLIDIGNQINTRFMDAKTGNPKVEHKFMLRYELPDDLVEKGEFAGQPLVMWKEYTLSLHEKAALVKVIAAVRGKQLAKDEEFDITSILGKPLMVQIAHSNKANGSPKADIVGVSHPHKSIKFSKSVNPLRLLKLHEFDQKVFSSLPEWVQKKIDLSQVPGSTSSGTGEF